MAWHSQGSRRYYYRKRKVAGKVVSEYIGPGRIGELSEQVDQLERQRRKAERKEERRRLAEVDDIDAQIDQLGERLQDLVTAALVVSGHHQHKRQWRLQRGTDDSGR